MVSVRQRDWETALRAWVAAPGTTEKDRCDNAISVVQGAIRAYAPLAGRQIEVYAKGSVANRTNVSDDSDVDVSVCYRGGYYYHFGPGVTAAEIGLVNHPYTYDHLRADVEAAMHARFGGGATPGTIAIKLRENTYRVRADVVAVFEHRWHLRQPTGQIVYHRGEWLCPPRRGQMTNWPEQNYRNGTDKNDRTGRRFKMLVRAIKALRYEMDSARVPEAKAVCSFLLESLVYNVPDSHMGDPSLLQDVRRALLFLWAAVRDGSAASWMEVNGLKLLFGTHQTWTVAHAEAFLLRAAHYVGFG